MKEESLQGYCIYPNASEIEIFDLRKGVNLKEWFYGQLLEGKINDVPNQTYKAFICDMKADESNFGGYIRGFLYNDKKFVGKIHYLPHDNKKDEVLNRTYIHEETCLFIKGILYTEQDSKLGFYIRMTNNSSIENNQINNRTVINEITITRKKTISKKEMIEFGNESDVVLPKKVGFIIKEFKHVGRPKEQAFFFKLRKGKTVDRALATVLNRLCNKVDILYSSKYFRNKQFYIDIVIDEKIQTLSKKQYTRADYLNLINDAYKYFFIRYS